MAKKGGKKSKANKVKSGAAGPATAKTASDVESSQTPGHEVEQNVNKAEGEVESGSEAVETAPSAAAETPSAAPPQATEDENKDTSASLPEAEKNTIQDTVDKTQASKAGQIGTVEGGEAEGSSVLPESTAKESKLTSPTFNAPDAAPTQEEVSAKEPEPVAHATESVDKATPVVEQPKEAAADVLTPPEIPKAEDTIGATATSAVTTQDVTAKAAPSEAAGKEAGSIVPIIQPEIPAEPKPSTVEPQAAEAPGSLGAAAAGVSSPAHAEKAETELQNKEAQLEEAKGPQKEEGEPSPSQQGEPAAKEEKPTETAAEKPAEEAAGEPAAKPAEQPAENPAEKPAEKPADKPVEKAADKVQEEGAKVARKKSGLFGWLKRKVKGDSK